LREANMLDLVLGLLALALAAIELGITIKLGLFGPRNQPPPPELTPQEIAASYRWRLFYVNGKDPRGLVPKANNGWGWTLNFRTPFMLRLFLGLLATMIALTIVLIARGV
jgi:uncharacterized membrane protein